MNDCFCGERNRVTSETIEHHALQVMTRTFRTYRLVSVVETLKYVLFFNYQKYIAELSPVLSVQARNSAVDVST